MKKFIKIIFYIIVLGAVLLTVAGFLAAKFIDPNDYKDKITTAVHEKTGRDLVIGDINLSFFPWIGARVHDIRLSNASGFMPQDRFMSAGEADVKIKLMPLLSRKVEVGKITLKNVDLNLAKNKVGLTNWQDLSGRQTSPTSNSTPSTNSTGASTKNTPASVFALSFAGIDIENANISWVDEQKGQNVQLHHVNVSSDNPQENKTFPFRTSFDINSTKPSVAGKFSFSSDVKFNVQQGVYQLTRPSLSFVPEKNAQALTFQADSLALDLHQQTMSVVNAAITGAGLNVKSNMLKGQQILSKPLFTGDLQVAPFNVKAFLKSMGKTITTTDPNALQQLSLTTQFEATTSSLRLNPLSIRLDNSTIQGSVNVASFSAQTINFDIAVDQLNADHYLPPKSQATTAASTPATTASGAAANSQPSAMRKATVNGKIRFGSLTIGGTLLSQVYAQIALANGVLRVDPLNANVYNGSTKGAVTVDFRGATPLYTINETLSNIDMTQLVKSGKLTGRANLVSHVTMQGNDKNAILRSLNGSLQFNLQNGALMGKDIPYEVERAVAVFKKQAPPPAPAKNQTDFDVFKGTGKFTNGVFSNNDLLVQSSKFKLTGSGTANLINEALNYHVTMVGLHTVNDAQGNAVQEQRQTQLPLSITGTFSNPIITPDLAALLKSEVGQKAVEKLNERLGERLGPEGGRAVGGVLRHLLNQ